MEEETKLKVLLLRLWRWKSVYHPSNTAMEAVEGMKIDFHVEPLEGGWPIFP